MRSILRASMVLAGTLSAVTVQAQGTAPVSDADWPRGVMRPVAMRDLTPAEQKAHNIWSMRAALNVAALQCQFSPFLRTVKNYNQILPHHAVELASALKTMNGHFVRLDGAKKARQTFDQYTTKTYNSFSTLDAQLTFCQKASEIGWEMLGAKKGDYADIAATRLPEIRQALVPTTNPLLLVRLGWMDAPRFVDPCVDRKGKAIPLGSKKCS